MTRNQVLYQEFKEQARHNRVSEAQGWETLAISSRSQAETARHNVVNEQISQSTLAEQIRHNQVNEALSQYQNETNRIVAETGVRQVAVNERNASVNERNALQNELNSSVSRTLDESQTQLNRAKTDEQKISTQMAGQAMAGNYLDIVMANVSGKQITNSLNETNDLLRAATGLSKSVDSAKDTFSSYKAKYGKSTDDDLPDYLQYLRNAYQ